MYKIGIIGDRDTVLGFMALGFSVFEAETPADAAKILKELVKSEEYAVLFLTEDLAVSMSAELAAVKDKPLPAVTTIPGVRGANGFGMASIKEAVERAVGADILFKD